MSDKKTLFITYYSWDWKKYEFFKEVDSLGLKYDVINQSINTKYNSRLKLIFFIWPQFALFSLRILFTAKKYDVVVFWTPLVALFLSMLHYLFPKDHPKLIFVGLIFAGKRNGFVSLIRRHLYRFMTSAMDCILCHSNHEAKEYARIFSIDEGKIRYLPLAISISKKFEVDHNYAHNDYIVSAGRSNRDYASLINITSELNYKLLIIADYTDSALPKMKNVEIIKNAYGFNYLKYIRDARFVVIPLKEHDYSSGQMVLLHSMLLGKTVMLTRTLWTDDYIENWHNGILINKEDREDFKKTIEYLYRNPDICEKIGKNAKLCAETKFSVKAYTKNIINHIKKTVFAGAAKERQREHTDVIISSR